MASFENSVGREYILGLEGVGGRGWEGEREREKGREGERGRGEGKRGEEKEREGER